MAYKVTPGVYKILNIVNGKVYIGSSSYSIQNRIQNHKKQLRRGEHKNKHLQAAWNKYGEDSFIFSIVEIVENQELVIQREQFYMDKYANEIGYGKIYNIARIASKTTGVKKTDEQKEKLSRIVKDKMSSLEVKSRMSKSQKERWRNPAYREEVMKRLKTQNRIRKKVYDGFVSPFGAEYKNVTNLSKFAKDHGLSLSGLCQIISGEQRTHRGWTAINPKKKS